MNSAAKALFVTGASGTLGRALLAELAHEKSLQRLVLLRHKREIQIPPALKDYTEVVDLSLEDREGLARALTGVGTLIHLVAATHSKVPNIYHEVNVGGTQSLLYAARAAGVSHVVFVSTTAVGEACGAYGASKVAAERMVRESGLPFTTIRFSEVYGGEGSSEGIDKLIRSANSSVFLPFVPGTFLAPVHISDALAPFVRAVMRHPEGKTYVIAGPEVLSFHDVARCIAISSGRFIPLVPVPRALLMLASRARLLPGVPDQIARLACQKDYDSSLARSELAFRPREFRDGIREILVAQRQDAAS